MDDNILIKDKKAFEDIFDSALKAETDFLLPDDFAEKISLKLYRQITWKSYLNEFFIYLSVFVLIIIQGLAIVYWVDNDFWGKVLVFIQEKYLLIAGINLILVLILFADKVLLRYFLVNTNKEFQ